MIDTVKIEGRQCIYGWADNIGLQNIRLNTEANLTVTATVSIYDSANSVIVNEVAMTIGGAGTPYNSASYALTTGSGKTISTAPAAPGYKDVYRAVYTVSYGGVNPLVVEQAITVFGKPF